MFYNKGEVMEKIICLLRKVFGYGILISVTLFILFWNLNLLIVYAIKRFDNWWEFIGFVIFIMVSLLVLWLVNLVCSKILLKDSFD